MSSSEFAGSRPLALGSLHGVRVWRPTADGTLTGWTFQQEWEPGQNLSVCRRTGLLGWQRASTRNPNLPAEASEDRRCSGVAASCGCGFWAYYTETPEFTLSGVVGVIEAYGKTTLGSKGFRAEKAKIVALAFPKVGRMRRLLHKAAEWTFAHGTLSQVIAPVTALAGVVPVVVFMHGWLAWVVGLAVSIACGLNAGFLYVLGERRWVTRVGQRIHYDEVAREGVPYAQTEEVEAKVRARYPDVPVYDSVEAMLAAHPLSEPERVPDTTPRQDNLTQTMQQMQQLQAHVAAALQHATQQLQKPQRVLPHFGLAVGGQVWPNQYNIGIETKQEVDDDDDSGVQAAD